MAGRRSNQEVGGVEAIGIIGNLCYFSARQHNHGVGKEEIQIKFVEKQ